MVRGISFFFSVIGGSWLGGWCAVGVSGSFFAGFWLEWPSMLRACFRPVCKSCVRMWNVNSVTLAASVPAPAVSASGFLMTVGSPWIPQSSFHRGCCSSTSRSSASSAAAASCFDTWLR